MDISALNSTASQVSAATKASAALVDNFDTFIILLTAQLQHQDPLEPMDSQQFIQQLVQFTNVEQTIATNQNLESLLALGRAGQAAQSVSYLGHSIEADGNTTQLSNGKAQWRYQIHGAAVSVQLSIQDAQGRTVQSTTGEITSGIRDFVWDGLGSDGNALPEGAYSLTIMAVDAKGLELHTSTQIRGRVSAVKNTDSGPVLMLGDAEVPFSKVTRVLDGKSNNPDSIPTASMSTILDALTSIVGNVAS